MIRACLAATMVLFLFSSSAVAGNKETAADVKAKLEREQDPVKRAQLQLRLAEFRLDEAKQLYDSSDDAKGLATLKDMQALVERSSQELFQTGRDPRKKPKGFKEGEIKLREMQRRLRDLNVMLPADDRPPIEEIIKRLGDIQEEFLYGIMRVKEPAPPSAPSQTVKEPNE